MRLIKLMGLSVVMLLTSGMILGQAPKPFNVTGGGTYCAGGSGLPVGLDGSEIGVTYTLYKNGVPQVPTVPGTGLPITFGNQLAGIYTVSGFNMFGTTPMNGSADIKEEPNLPVSVSIAASANPVCAGTSVTFTATPVNGGATPTYQWYRNGTPAGTNSPTYTYTPNNNDQVYVVMTSSLTCTTGNPATSNTITMTVNANLPVSVSIAASANPVCAGTSVTFTATPVNGGTTPVYQWYRNGTAVGTNSPVYTYTPSNNDQVYVVLTSSLTCTTGNPATSNTITMTVNPVPAATASNNGPVCTGTPLNLTGGPAGMASYSWTGPNSFSSNQQSPVVSSSATLAMAGTYTLTVTSANGCQGVATTNVVVYTSPVANAGTGGDECDLNFTFNAVPSVGTGTWTKTAGPGNATFNPNANSPTATVTVTAYGQYIFTWTEVNGTCSSAASIIVNFNQPPVANGGSGGNECDLNFVLNATAPLVGTGLWSQTSGPGTSVFTPNASTPNATVTVSAYGRYRFLWTVTNGACSDTAQITVNFYQQPVANAGPGGNECDLNFVLAAVPSVGTGTWTRVSGTGTATFTPNANSPTATVTVSAYGTYILRWTEVNGTCTSSDTLTVRFSQQPVANAGTGGNACDLNFRLGAVPSVGTGLWTLTSGPGTAVFAPNANTYNATVTVSLYGTYVFTWTETNNNCSSSASVTVNFYQQPVANAGTGGNNCGPDFNLKATPSVGVGTWTRVSGPGTATFSPNANSPTAKVTVSAYGTYVFRWTEVNGTCTSSATVSVTFIQQPSADAGNGGDECDLDFQLNAKPGTGTGTWSKISGPGNVTFTPNANTANAKVTVTQFGEYDLAWTETNSTCTSTDIIRVTFHDKPSINAGDDVPVCEQGSVQLRAIGEGTGGTYLWSPANLVNNPNIDNPVASPLVTTIFTVTYTDRYGCTNSDQVTVEVRKRPVAKAGTDQVLDYIFETDLEAVLAYAYETGKWTVLEGTGKLDNENNPKTHVNNLSLGKNRILWTVSNGACPSVFDTVNITVNNLKIPTLITPNLDGKNDFFVIRGIETLGNCELIVFNRWGAVVYKNSEYDNSWDGKDDKGNDLPAETYFFIFKPEKSLPLSGYIIIRR